MRAIAYVKRYFGRNVKLPGGRHCRLPIFRVQLKNKSNQLFNIRLANESINRKINFVHGESVAFGFNTI